MKKSKIISVIIAIFLVTALFSGCNDNNTPQKVYSIGKYYTFNTVKVKLENNIEEERFVLFYKILDQDGSTHFFSFAFICNTKTLRNSENFDYKDDSDSEIVFNKNGYYEFYDSKIFYISYKNADEEIKDIIYSEDYSIELPIGTFTLNQRDF